VVAGTLSTTAGLGMHAAFGAYSLNPAALQGRLLGWRREDETAHFVELDTGNF